MMKACVLVLLLSAPAAAADDLPSATPTPGSAPPPRTETEAPTPPPATHESQPQEERASKLHAPAEIIDIMEKSSIVYELGLDDDIEPLVPKDPRVLRNDLVLRTSGTGVVDLMTLEVSKAAGRLIEAGVASFQKKDYDQALKSYTKAHAIDPDYHHLLTLIGDVHYMRGDYEEAIRSFETAIERNFADYDAHWFLADALRKTGRQEAALRSMTTAHLLNRNHTLLRESLARLRQAAGRPWDGWTWGPRFRLEKVDDRKIKVTVKDEWMMYGMVKAVWAFEPGYAEATAGPDYAKQIVCMEEEKEGLVGLYVANEKNENFATLRRIVDDGYVSEMIYYEMIGPKAPEALLLLPREAFNRVLEYVDKYH